MGKRVAIIGAGASGLSAIKCCLDEGLEPVCFEKADDIGGLWYYRENREDQACVYESTVINTSKEMMCFSDFPIPEDFPNFMHNTLVRKYYHLFCDRFGLRKYIQFNTKVNSAVFADDYKESGKWKVTTTHQSTDKSIAEIYDAVLVCTGHHCTPYIPEFEGLKEFRGRVLHTHDYLNPKGFEKKRILIIGVGNSGCDAAVELGGPASQVYLSTRRGMWVLHRLADGNIFFPSRLFNLLPDSMLERAFQSAVEKRVNHKFLGIQPNHSVMAQHPTVNDFLPNCIVNRSVIMKPDIKHFTPTGVVFQDGTTEDLDVVILGTGYVFEFPFLEDSVIKVEKNQLPLYKYVFPPNLPHPTIAFLGYIQPLGAINPISEIQARWATRVFKGHANLPTTDKMYADILSKYEAISKRYISSQRHTIQVDFIKYMDDVAVEFGVKPNFWKILLEDPALAIKCMCGPFVPYQYRLVGPGKWKGAREAIFTIYDRVNKPLQTRKVPVQVNQSRNFISSWIIYVVVLFFALYFVWF